jgi:diguanylate cyclase (GGDEF)-like protein
MEKNFIDKNKKNVIIIITFFIIFTLVSYLFITNKYAKFEENINNTNISNLIDKIKSKIDFNHKVALEYSTSDEVYNFMENGNKDYIYKNFRKGSYTLEDVGLSYFILTDNKNNIKYSKFTRNTRNRKCDIFAKFVVKKFKNTNKINKIIIYQNQAYFISKTPIYKTDYENTSNGFLYSGTTIDKAIIKNLSQGFINIKFIENPKINLEKNKSNNLETVSIKAKIQSKIKKNINISEVSFYDNRSDLLFTIKVQREIKSINDVKYSTLIIFLCLALITILTLLYISNRYRYNLKKQYESTEETIEIQTCDMRLAMQELKRVNKNLYELAHTDFLTKTMNRRNFFIHAQNNFAIAENKDQLLCVVMIDIDNFKKFNDKYGHNVGDKVLIHFAEKIKSSISEKTIFGRLGGEEFALVISNTNLEDAILKAEKLKKKIEENELVIDGNTLKITASFGVSDNQNCSNIDEMLQKADNLLYTAKESGRNLVRSRLNFC